MSLAPDGLQLCRQTRARRPAQVATLRRGQALERGRPWPMRRCAGRRVRVYGPEGAFLGLAELLADGRLQPRRLRGC